MKEKKRDSIDFKLGFAKAHICLSLFSIFMVILIGIFMFVSVKVDLLKLISSFGIMMGFYLLLVIEYVFKFKKYKKEKENKL